MQLQVALYAVAAKRELEYQPELGLVRYLDADDPQKSELKVPLDEEALNDARKKVSTTAKRITNREFNAGPISTVKNNSSKKRCVECDFASFCGMQDAAELRKNRS